MDNRVSICLIIIIIIGGNRSNGTRSRDQSSQSSKLDFLNFFIIIYFVYVYVFHYYTILNVCISMVYEITKYLKFITFNRLIIKLSHRLSCLKLPFYFLQRCNYFPMLNFLSSSHCVQLRLIGDFEEYYRSDLEQLLLLKTRLK